MICKIDETEQDYPEAVPGLHVPQVMQKFIDSAESVRRELINIRETIPLGLYPWLLRHNIGDILSLIAYACETPSRRKRTPMDVDKMVKTWLPLIKKLATAHDIDEKDAASSELDEHLGPIIAAPIAQIREFYRKLFAELKADPAVPWAVWRLFEVWGSDVLDKITRDDELVLKKELATKIAEHSITLIPTEDWINSMVGALQWRSPEKLKAIDESLQSGNQPRVRGKESCLFLQVGEDVEVML